MPQVDYPVIMAGPGNMYVHVILPPYVLAAYSIHDWIIGALHGECHKAA